MSNATPDTLEQIPMLTVTLPDGRPHVMYSAWPKQVRFHQSNTTNLIAIGSRGSGKSIALRMDAHMRAMSCPGSNLVLIRKTYKDLLKSHLIYLPDEMKLLGGSFHKTDYIAYYPNSSKLFLSYVGHSEDSMNLLGAEFLAAYFDELSVIPWEFFNKLCASVRVPVGSGLTAVVRAATNPLGESAGEINKYFCTKDVDPEEDPDYLPNEWEYIQINMEDNPSLDMDQYRKRFAGLEDHVRKAWLYGEFSDETSLFDFRPTKEGEPYHVIHELDIDELVAKARIFRVLDWGWSPDPCYCAWVAHLGNRYIVFHEKLWWKTIVPDVAAEILSIDAQLGITKVAGTYCDPTLDIHSGAEVRTNKGIFEAHGVPLECSINNRELFAAMIHNALAEEAGPNLPRIQFYKGYGPGTGCPYLIKSIPLQRYDEKRPLAMANQKHDHPVVALAYFLISHSSHEQRTAETKKMRRWLRPKHVERLVLGHENVRHQR